MFSRKVQIQTDKIEAFLENIPLPRLINEQTLSCEVIISEDKVFKSLKSMENNKSPGNDRLSKEFDECFWDKTKKLFLASIQKVFVNQKLSTSQKQTVMKILGKKGKGKRFTEDWRPKSLLNTDIKIIITVLSTRIKIHKLK